MTEQQKAALDFLEPEPIAASYLSLRNEKANTPQVYLELSAEWLRLANAIKGVA